MSTEIATIENDGLGQALMGHRVDLARMLGGDAEAERFIAEAFSAINANPFLRQCTPESLFGALYFAAQINLPVGGPLQQFHLTPRKSWSSAHGAKVWQVVPVVGYGGLIRLAMNSGEYDSIEGILVHELDEFEPPYDDESGTHFKLRAARGDRGPVIGVIGRALVKGSDRSIIEYLTTEEVLTRHRPRDWEKTPWKDHEAQMIQKTGIRVVSKYTSKSANSVRFAQAIEADTAVVNLDEQGNLTVDHSEPPSEDWPALINAATDVAEVQALWQRLVDTQPRDVETMRPLIAVKGASLKAAQQDSRPADERPSAEEIAAAAIGRSPHVDDPMTEEQYVALSIAQHERDQELAAAALRATA